MKISLSKKFGCVQVRGGNVVRALLPQASSTDQASSVEPVSHREGTKTLAIKTGDLAIELVNVKLDKVIGYSFLSGEAIRTNIYTVRPEWFEPASAVQIPVRAHRVSESPHDYMDEMIGTFMTVKYQHDLGVFRLIVPKDQVREAGEAIKTFYSYEKRDAPRDEARGHVIGLICAGSKKRPAAGLHFQPPRDASELYASQFQTTLVIEATGVKEL